MVATSKSRSVLFTFGKTLHFMAVINEFLGDTKQKRQTAECVCRLLIHEVYSLLLHHGLFAIDDVGVTLDDCSCNFASL
jgi:hypothetical protein